MSSDRVVRALTDDGSFRVVVVSSTATAQGAIDAQKAEGSTAQRFGELITGAVLVRETMSPDNRVQVIAKGAGGNGTLVADAHPGGLTRGLIQLKDGRFNLGEGAMLQVVRSLVTGGLHQGVVNAPESNGVSGALTSYMLASEQIVSTIGVACTIEGGVVTRAGGFIVQILPEVAPAVLEAMTVKLEALEPPEQMLAAAGGDPDALLARLLAGVEHTKVNESPIHYGCACDTARVLSALASLGAEELRRVIEAEEILDIGCDYCGKRYHIQPAQLRGLLDAS